MNYYCTYFDAGYLARGLMLYQSLCKQDGAFQLWILCMDDACYATLARLNLPQVRLIALGDFECGDDALVQAKNNRTRMEYYFTCTPSLPLYIFRAAAQIDLLTYLDADLFFFNSPAVVFAEIADHSIAIVPHRFPPGQEHFERYGIYNVGWISFRRDHQGLACLQRWREQCLAWCEDRALDGRFADQKYLDEWTARYSNLIVLQHKGVNLAPWNLANYQLREHNGTLWVDDQPLIFYHFHGLARIQRWLYDPGLTRYKAKYTHLLRDAVYMPYIQAWCKADQTTASHVTLTQSRLSHISLGYRIARTLKQIVCFVIDLMTGQLILVPHIKDCLPD